MVFLTLPTPTRLTPIPTPLHMWLHTSQAPREAEGCSGSGYNCSFLTCFSVVCIVQYVSWPAGHLIPLPLWFYCLQKEKVQQFLEDQGHCFISGKSLLWILWVVMSWLGLSQDTSFSKVISPSSPFSSSFVCTSLPSGRGKTCSFGGALQLSHGFITAAPQDVFSKLVPGRSQESPQCDAEQFKFLCCH